MRKPIREQKWKTVKCHVDGYDCWCRLIVVADAGPKKSDGEYYNKDTFMPTGCISKDQAEYFVKLHNNTLKG